MNTTTDIKKEILIVDDNPRFVTSLENLICDVNENLINKIDKAYNGEDGLSMILNNRYKIVFMDIDMPKLNGIAATKKADNEIYRTKTVIIAISFHNDYNYMEQMIFAGARKFISKDKLTHDVIKEVLNTYL